MMPTAQMGTTTRRQPIRILPIDLADVVQEFLTSLSVAFLQFEIRKITAFYGPVALILCTTGSLLSCWRIIFVRARHNACRISILAVAVVDVVVLVVVVVVVVVAVARHRHQVTLTESSYYNE